ncbi:MAG: hypothetical protein LBM25_07785 [Bacteroidales bacterium]|nr:hypothetical protein [Bacteroidales bacterium]
MEVEKQKRESESIKFAPLDWNLFTEKLNLFAQNIGQEDANLHFLLTNCEIINNNDNSATIVLKSPLQEKWFKNYQLKIVEYIKNETSCSNFRFLHTLEQEKVKEKLYRPLDKFNFLAQKNPEILELRKKFELDIDF